MTMYLKWNTKTITDFSDENINSLYNDGYLFGRTGKGEMYQTRSLRIDLEKFDLSSENKRILRKTEEIKMEICLIPYDKYHWSIGKLAKDFYDTKFGSGTFSANKIKKLMTDENKSNFNLVLVYDTPARLALRSMAGRPLPPLEGGTDSDNGRSISPLEGGLRGVSSGYCIIKETDRIVHYCYPFYNLETSPKNMGLGMMLRAIVWAKENNRRQGETSKKYIYLGSYSRPTDTYKLQFKGLEWFDNKKWSDDLDKLKNIIQPN